MNKSKKFLKQKIHQTKIHTILIITSCHPIMAHPPSKSSDLSLEDFFDILMSTPSNIQVVKLDFKSIDILEPSLKLASSKKCPFDIWLNADILATDNSKEPLNAHLFLQLCQQYFAKNQSKVVLSPGFVTHLKGSLKYSMENMKAMHDLISQTSFKNISFPLRALFLSHSKTEVIWLLEHCGKCDKISTVTIWGQDELNTEEKDKLRDIISSIGRNHFYLDVDEDLKTTLLS